MTYAETYARLHEAFERDGHYFRRGALRSVIFNETTAEAVMSETSMARGIGMRVMGGKMISESIGDLSAPYFSLRREQALSTTYNGGPLDGRISVTAVEAVPGSYGFRYSRDCALLVSAQLSVGDSYAATSLCTVHENDPVTMDETVAYSAHKEASDEERYARDRAMRRFRGISLPVRVGDDPTARQLEEIYQSSPDLMPGAAPRTPSRKPESECWGVMRTLYGDDVWDRSVLPLPESREIEASFLQANEADARGAVALALAAEAPREVLVGHELRRYDAQHWQPLQQAIEWLVAGQPA